MIRERESRKTDAFVANVVASLSESGKQRAVNFAFMAKPAALLRPYPSAAKLDAR